MRYTVSMTEELAAELELCMSGSVEQAAFLLGKTSVTGDETRILLREVLRVEDEDILSAFPTSMSLLSRSFMRAMKRADRTRQVFFFIHSHPTGPSRFSAQDDIQEAALMRTAYIRIAGPAPHGTMVFAGANRIIGRCWMQDGSQAEIAVFRIVGKQLRFFSSGAAGLAEGLFDRQVRAFGGGIQALLQGLHVGVVGCGGTGSAVAEQLVRLGVGRLTLFDPDQLERSNISRVYGSSVNDLGEPKVAVLTHSLQKIGMPANITSVHSAITVESTARRLRDCDVLFGCTDDQWGRAVLTRLALYYYIPIFDMGVRIDSTAGTIRSIQGRVTALLPDTACLFCRNRVSGEEIAEQAIRENDPERADALRKEGYLAEIPEVEPAVITFNTAVAAWAVVELLQRLTGFMGESRQSSEMIWLFDQSKIRPNAREKRPECFCSDPRYRGRGDVVPFLDMTWPSE